MHSADTLLIAHELLARSGTAAADAGRPPIYKVVGIILAISSGVFIGISFVIKKVGLLKANAKYNEEAGEGYGYLKNAWWWLGMTLMIIGEICNFVAYAFVDAILVTPMGALTVVIAAILSAIFLKERLSFVGQVGCFNCIIGSVVIVINAPSQSAVANIQDMQRLVIAPGFLSYAGVIIIACIVIAWWLGPKYGKKSMLVYLSICSLIGGLSVVATQGLGAAIVAQIAGTPQFTGWFIYVLLVFVISTLVTEIIYLNKALNLFNAALVTPTYYVFFTSSTIVTSAILFRGFKGTPSSIATVIMGFLQICAGVVLLQLSKSAKDVPDSQVFKGDLDQVRTVAEQEEPEYEPRADTIRGAAGILRSLSSARNEKQAQEARKLQEEHMQPIGESEQVEFDGIRRRRTVLNPDGQPVRSGTVLVRRKTTHPPLGMSQFPPQSDDEDEEDTGYHPGFFQRLRSRGKSTNTAPPPASMGMGPLPLTPMSTHDGAGDSDSEKKIAVLGIRATTADATTYENDTLHPPRPPPHIAKRQFSFQNVFSSIRHRSGSSGDYSHPPIPQEQGPSKRPVTAARRKSSHGMGRGDSSGGTEEERLGLVKGDSEVVLPLHLPRSESPMGYGGDDDDGVWSARGPEREYESFRDLGRDEEAGRREWEEREQRKGGGAGRAFL